MLIQRKPFHKIMLGLLLWGGVTVNCFADFHCPTLSDIPQKIHQGDTIETVSGTWAVELGPTSPDGDKLGYLLWAKIVHAEHPMGIICMYQDPSEYLYQTGAFMPSTFSTNNWISLGNSYNRYDSSCTGVGSGHTQLDCQFSHWLPATS